MVTGKSKLPAGVQLPLNGHGGHLLLPAAVVVAHGQRLQGDRAESGPLGAAGEGRSLVVVCVSVLVPQKLHGGLKQDH